MIQDIEPHVMHNQYQPRPVKDGDHIIYAKNGCVLIHKKDDSYEVPSLKYSDSKLINSLGEIVEQDNLTYLFRIDETAYFWDRFAIHEDEIIPDGMEYIHIQILSRMEPKWQGFACASAVHLINWYTSMKYCGICGREMRHDEKERMMFCPECKNMQFPKICPVVIVGVIKGNKMLLTKYTDRGRYARYSLIAGFAEFGETIEQTVHREALEETNLNVKNLHYYKSQPWAFSSSLLMGFFCELDGAENIKFTDNELCVADWVDPCDMPDDTDHLSLTAEMMQQFKKYGREVLNR